MGFSLRHISSLKTGERGLQEALGVLAVTHVLKEE